MEAEAVAAHLHRLGIALHVGAQIDHPSKRLADPLALVAAHAEITALQSAGGVGPLHFGDVAEILSAQLHPFADAEREAPAGLALNLLLIQVALQRDTSLPLLQGVEYR